MNDSNSDYGMGNLASVQKAFLYQLRVCITNDKQVHKCFRCFAWSEAYAPAMEALKVKDLMLLKDIVNRNKPFLGIFLGMQYFSTDLKKDLRMGSLLMGLGLFPVA